MVQVVIHTNPTLDNQVETAGWLKKGFEAHGITADVTADTRKPGDIQVVQGPHYCFDYWRERSAVARVLWLNRCHYGHPRWFVSLGWLRPDGGRDFPNRGSTDGKGMLPPLKARKDECRRAVIFASWGERIDPAPYLAKYDEVRYRPHPKDRVPDLGTDIPIMGKPRYGLDEVFDWSDVAIGHSSTTLVEARLNGLHIECTDPTNPVTEKPDDDAAWVRWLTWTQWNHKELERGDFLGPLGINDDC